MAWHDGRREGRFPRSGRGLRLAALLVVVGIGAGVAAAGLLGEQPYRIGPFGVRARWSPSLSGTTELRFPPLGAAAAATHRGPGRLVVSLEEIDFDALADILAQPAGDGTVEAFRGMAFEAARRARAFALRLIGLGLAGGAAGGAVLLALLKPRLAAVARAAGLAGLSGALALGLLAAWAWATFDPSAFRSPTYRGALASLPWVVDAVQQAVGQVEEVGERLRTLARSVYQMYQRIEALPPPLALEEADVTILHITDIHNHPAAMDVAREIARAFSVDFAVNTGDLTDLGTRLEAELLRGLREFPVPHLFVTGNHETPEVAAALSLIEPVRLIDGQMVEASGVRILGIGDPAAAGPSASALTPAEAKMLAEEINGALAGMTERPDILALHNHRVASAIRPGLVPLVLFGHSHAPGVSFRGGTAYVNAGTTGGAGVRGFQGEEPVRISLAVIYLSLDGGVRPLAVDVIRLSPIAEGFVLERHLAPAP
ncbi:MAG: metallophosphoesterase family protein [Limnochordia bacterium]